MMRPSTLLPCFCGILSTAGALSLREPRDAAPRVLKFDLQRNEIREPITHDRNRLRRRDDTLSIDLDNEQTLYSLNLTLGSPEQQFSVNIDTGSSDLWVNAEESSLCSQHARACNSVGTYNANSSSSYNYVGSWFNITYVDGSGAAGDYVTDTLRVAGQTIQDFQFGVGYESSSAHNILGIGYPINEAQVANQGRKTYENLPARLASDGAIASRSFSLWLNDLDSNTGNLLFGGVDRSQYHGDLVSLPIQRGSDDAPHSEFYVTLTGLDLDGDNIGRDLALAVLLDSGTSLTYLPNDITASIYDAVDASFDESQGSAIVPCSVADQNVNMTFRFSDPAAIEVPIDELVLDVLSGGGDPAGIPPPFAEEVEKTCLFGIVPSEGGSAVLGETFLRSAYVVFDMDNNEISIAQSTLNATGSDIVEIGTGDDAVPSAVQASESVQATAGLPRVPDGAGESSDDEDAARGLVPSRSHLAGAVVLSALLGFVGLLA